MKEILYINKGNYDQVMYDKNKQKWHYYSKKEAEKIGLTNQFRTIGEINLKNKSKVVATLKKDNQILEVKRYIKRNIFSTKVLGYIECVDEDTQDHELLVIVKDRMLRNAILSILLLCLLTMASLWWMNRERGPVFDDEAIAYKMPDGAVNEDSTRIAIPGYSELVMKADTDELYAALVNPEGNPCYFKYQIMLEEGSQLLYSSDYIEPGKAITNIKLKQKISKGSYNVKIIVTPYDINEYEKQLNGGVIETTLVAK